MRSYRITAYPGDGIGREVTAETLRVLDAVQDVGGDFRLDVTQVPWGSDYYQRHGTVVPDDYLDQLAPSDAIFLGAIGDPARIPDHVTLAPADPHSAALRPVRLREARPALPRGSDASGRQRAKGHRPGGDSGKLGG